MAVPWSGWPRGWRVQWRFQWQSAVATLLEQIPRIMENHGEAELARHFQTKTAHEVGLVYAPGRTLL